MAKVVSQAMEQAGIRPSQRHRKVSDYVLEQLIGEGPGYQDWQASHVQVTESKRRVRLYLVRSGTRQKIAGPTNAPPCVSSSFWKCSITPAFSALTDSRNTRSARR